MLKFFSLNSHIVWACGIYLLSSASFAGEKVEGKRYFELESGGPHYANAHELCAAKAKQRHDDKSVDKPYDHVVGEKDDGANVWCNLANSTGDENDQHFGSEEWECPSNSNRANYGCECEDGYVSTGKACEKPGTPRTKEELLATPQNHDPEGCGITKEQYEALNEVLGKKFTNVPYLNDAWTAAVAIKPELENNVAVLTPETKTQKDRKFFVTARDTFWDILAGKNAIQKKFAKQGVAFPQNSVDKARETFAKAGITLPNNETGGKKRAALITINGEVQQIDIDHIIGFAEAPNRMIDPSNLQLSPAKENRFALEEIANKDIFYDPAAYLEKERKKMEQAPPKCETRARCDSGSCQQ